MGLLETSLLSHGESVCVFISACPPMAVPGGASHEHGCGECGS